MLRLAAFAIALAFVMGLTAGLVRSLVRWRRGMPNRFPKGNELGFLIPMVPLWISGAPMIPRWSPTDSYDDAVWGFLWRATLVYFLPWMLLGRRVQAAVEGWLRRQVPDGRR